MVEINIDNNLYLRNLQHYDAESIFTIIDSQRDYLGRWLPFVKYTLRVEDSINAMQFLIDSNNPVFAIVFCDEFIGLAGFKGTDSSNHRTEIGYWLSQKHQGQGIMTSAVRVLCNYAFENMGVNRIQIRCAVGNAPSSNIPKRLNFYFEGIERSGEYFGEGKYADLEVYSKLKNDNNK